MLNVNDTSNTLLNQYHSAVVHSQNRDVRARPPPPRVGMLVHLPLTTQSRDVRASPPSLIE